MLYKLVVQFQYQAAAISEFAESSTIFLSVTTMCSVN